MTVVGLCLRALIVAYGWMLPREVEMVNMSIKEVKCKAL